MRQIQKNYETNVVKQHKDELIAAHLDEDRLLEPVNYPGYTGKKLYRYVRDIKIIPHFWDLKHQMYEEQGGICCYCGLKIFKDRNGRKMSVEHLVPKGIQRELVGEYKNLLLSCTIINDDTSLLGVNSINDPNLQHCDDSKGDTILNHTPLDINCERLFVYDSMGKVSGIDESVNADIITLGLNCQLLIERRKAALSILFDDNGNMVSDDELKIISANIMLPDANNNLREFCFVIKQVADSFISHP